MLKRSSSFLLTFALLFSVGLNIPTVNAGAATTTSTASTSALAKVPGYFNRFITQKFGAEPYVMVYNDGVYVYMSSYA